MTTTLAAALGNLDSFDVGDGTAEAAGWLLHPARPIDAVQVRVDGQLLGDAPMNERPDVAAIFPPVPHAAASGFRVRGRFAAAAGIVQVEMVGLAHNHGVIRAEDYWPLGGVPAVPTPGSALMERVSAGQEPSRFNRTGLAIAAQLLAAVRTHLPAVEVPRLLDWGCGSARATRFMPMLWPGLRPVGCDIDAEAIGWCQAHVPDASFHVTGPLPPLPFADGAFDAVVAASVMTHLAWPMQLRWLEEIRRVLAPRGVFVASVHGALAAVPLPADQRAALATRGMLDATPDAHLDGIAPDGYYRATYQTERHTRAHWQRGFVIRAWHDGGLGNWQDLVVLQREQRRWPMRLLRSE